VSTMLRDTRPRWPATSHSAPGGIRTPDPRIRSPFGGCFRRFSTSVIGRVLPAQGYTSGPSGLLAFSIVFRPRVSNACPTGGQGIIGPWMRSSRTRSATVAVPWTLHDVRHGGASAALGRASRRASAVDAGERVGGPLPQFATLTTSVQPDQLFPHHSHDQEQLTYCLRGSIRFHMADESFEVPAGTAILIPPQVPHEAVAGDEGAVVLSVVVPARRDDDDYELLDDASGHRPSVGDKSDSSSEVGNANLQWPHRRFQSGRVSVRTALPARRVALRARVGRVIPISALFNRDGVA
jgi:quercetin dioxygenase-like cupin family protein